MVGEERLLTGPEAGITRDSILVPWEWEGRMINLVDTAGIRRKSRVEGKLEKLAVGDSLRSIQYAEIVVLLLDATIPFEKQDLQLADLVEREGRALVIAVNKWDLIEDKNKALAELREQCERLLPQLRGVPLVTISGLQGRNIDRLMDAVFKIEQAWNTHISTSKLNRWLGADDREPSATGGVGPAPQAALHDAGQDPAAELHRLRLAARRGAGRLPALPRQRHARGLSTCPARRSGSGCAAARTRSTTATIPSAS